MSKTANRIKINNELWFTVLGNKLVFGNSRLDKNHHKTISFGNNSGFFDLHLKNEKTNKYWSIFQISHQNVAAILPQLIFQIHVAYLNIQKLDKTIFNTKDLQLYKFEELGDLSTELKAITKKDRVVIDEKSPEFMALVNGLIQNHKMSECSLQTLERTEQFIGMATTESENFILYKSPFIGSEIYRIGNIDLSIESVLAKILGADVYSQIVSRINEGLRELEK